MKKTNKQTNKQTGLTMTAVLITHKINSYSFTECSQPIRGEPDGSVDRAPDWQSQSSGFETLRR